MIWIPRCSATTAARREGAERNGARPLPFDRDELGRMVREAWVRWAQTQPNPKPSWLLPYEQLSERDKEADRQIGEAVARWTLIGAAARYATDEGAELRALDEAAVIKRCAEHLDELAIDIRDNSPRGKEGLITALAGTYAGALFDAATSLRALAARDAALTEGEGR